MILLCLMLCPMKRMVREAVLNMKHMKYYVFLFTSSEVVKKLPGIRKYVDPHNYSSPDAALKDFALEIPSHQLQLGEIINEGEILCCISESIINIICDRAYENQPSSRTKIA